jgi:hypothetical protein
MKFHFDLLEKLFGTKIFLILAGNYFYLIYKTWSSGPGRNQMTLTVSFVPKNTKSKHQITNPLWG